jgi:cold-inducible RNA-binding protein
VKIFVGNLGFGATEESLKALFERYGIVDRVRIMTDRQTAQSRVFGFVEMAKDSEADQAISALNGFIMEGRALNVAATNSLEGDIRIRPRPRSH